jgi:protein TonB
VQSEKKKEEEKKKPPPPPPPPPPKIKAAPKPPPQEVKAPPPPPAPVHETHAAPTPTPGLEFSNTGPGIDVGAGSGEVKPKNPGDGETHKPEAVKKPTAVKKPDADTGDSHDIGQGPAPCTEEATKPEPIQKTDIEYTEEARANGVEGRLVLKISIDENGAVTDVSVASSVDPSLDAAAIAAVKQWRFKPSTKCGKPIAGSYTLARRFELGD